MGRNIVFFGGCQAAALKDIYQQYIAPPRSETVVCCGPDVLDASMIMGADVVVEQMFDSHSRIDRDRLRSHVTYIRFPLMMAQFLWPYSGQPHIQNRAYPYLPAGHIPTRWATAFLTDLSARSLRTRHLKDTII
jgi:hypothetical protein